ncbi:hypothetical protein MMC19_005217 [Ptychographa xylographoides]|nr:hypothetical protein [Ptychographa xylographoides]
MAGTEKDFARFSSHNGGGYQYNYLPRLNFAEGSRDPRLNAPLPSTYQPRQSMASDSGHHHHHNPTPAPEQSFPPRRTTSTEQPRHQNGLNQNGISSAYLSRHDPGTDSIRHHSSPMKVSQSNYNVPSKEATEGSQQQHHHDCEECAAAARAEYAPRRENSTDSQNLNTYLNEDMSEEAALRKIKTAQTISLSPELFEKLYLSPQTAVKGDLRKTFANPTPIALIGYVLSLTPLACDLMGWRGAGGAGAASNGAYYFFGGVLMLLGGILEFILGNTFSSVVFSSYGAFWFALGAAITPFFNTSAPYDPTNPAAGAATPGYESSWAFFLLFMALLSFIYLICSLRTNIMFVIVFAGLMIGFLLEASSYWNDAAANPAMGQVLLVAAGAIYFVACLAGWWVLLSQLLASVDFPIQIPVGDISHLIKGYSERPRSSKGYPV